MSELIFGVMTGTSMDAIDIGLLKIVDGKPYNLKDFSSKPFPNKLRIAINSLIAVGSDELEKSQLASIEFSYKIAQIINSMMRRNELKPSQVLGIGVHGQTVRHKPEKNYTIQLCNPAIISQNTKLNVVSDFRSTDIIVGGQGAPFAPIFHQEIVSSHAPCTVINIGGISNVSIISQCDLNGARAEKGFDTGPGNCLSDIWFKKHFHKPYDRNGKFARSGSLNCDLLNEMMSDPYFEIIPPKSTGLHYFNENWLNAKLKRFKNKINNKDVQATIVELTAMTIKENLPSKHKKIFICGGGSKNLFLMERLKKIISCKIFTTNELGWNPQAIESACFAWLAYKTLNNQSLDLRKITGSKKLIKLGNITLF